VNAPALQVERLRSQLTGIYPVAIDALPASGGKLPPYGREVADAIRLGRRVNVFVYVGRGAWERAKRRRASVGIGQTMVVPGGEDAASFTWPAFESCTVVGDTYAAVFRTCHAIVSAGASIAVGIHGTAALGVILRHG
jgi:hypothetical protein